MNARTPAAHWLDSALTWSAIAAIGLVLARLIARTLVVALLLGRIVPTIGVLLLATTACGMFAAFLLRKRRGLGLGAARLLLVLIVAALVWISIPQIVAHGALLASQSGFERVIAAVKAGQLAPDEWGLVQLPEGYGFSTSGALQVLVRGQGEDLTVSFLTSLGAVGGMAGYGYAIADTFQPDEPDMMVEAIKDHWYWVQLR